MPLATCVPGHITTEGSSAAPLCPCPPTSRTLPAYRQLSSQQAAAYCQLSSQQPTAALPLTTLQLMLLSLNCGCEPWSMKARSSSTTMRPPRTGGHAAAASSSCSNKELLKARSLTAPKHNNNNIVISKIWYVTSGDGMSVILELT